MTSNTEQQTHTSGARATEKIPFVLCGYQQAAPATAEAKAIREEEKKNLV